MYKRKDGLVRVCSELEDRRWVRDCFLPSDAPAFDYARVFGSNVNPTRVDLERNGRLVARYRRAGLGLGLVPVELPPTKVGV